MGESKFAVGQKVKFSKDHDRMTGEVLEIRWNSTDGFVYIVSSRYYDVNLHDMVKGHITCREDELVDMTNYTGTTEPEKPDKTVEVKDQVNAGESAA